MATRPLALSNHIPWQPDPTVTWLWSLALIVEGQAWGKPGNSGDGVEQRQEQDPPGLQAEVWFVPCSPRPATLPPDLGPRPQPVMAPRSPTIISGGFLVPSGFDINGIKAHMQSERLQLCLGDVTLGMCVREQQNQKVKCCANRTRQRGGMEPVIPGPQQLTEGAVQRIKTSWNLEVQALQEKHSTQAVQLRQDPAYYKQQLEKILHGEEQEAD
eukprot:gi/632989234/ref/XP_007883539.1/ PREDICTED: uncharacterized protein LOC103172601 [Callorhinchus milii]